MHSALGPLLKKLISRIESRQVGDTRIGIVRSVKPGSVEQLSDEDKRFGLKPAYVIEGSDCNRLGGSDRKASSCETEKQLYVRSFSPPTDSSCEHQPAACPSFT